MGGWRRRSRDSGLQPGRKRAQEDQDERGYRPEAWVYIKKATKRKNHSLENMYGGGWLALPESPGLAAFWVLTL